MAPQIAKAVGGTWSLWLLRVKPNPGVEARSDMNNALSLSDLGSVIRQEYTGWRMKRSWPSVLSRSRILG